MTPSRAEVPRSRPVGWNAKRGLIARRVLLTLFSIALLALAGWALVREFAHMTLRDVATALAGWSAMQLLLASAASIGVFLVVAAAEWRGLRWLKVDVAPATVLKISVIANGLSHALGAAMLVGAAIRARLYARRGVDLATVGAVVIFQSVSFGLGLAALLGLALLTHVGSPLRLGGMLLLAGVGVYMLACGLVRRPIHLGKRSYRLPSVADAVWQIVLGMADNALAVVVLWILLPAPVPSFLAFVDAYVLAYIGGAASGVPGGAGVFEAAVSHLAPSLDRAGLAAALLGFRMLFYVAPLVIAAVMLLLETLQERRQAA